MCTSPLRAFYTGAKTENGGDLLAISKSFQGLEQVRYEVARKCAREPFPLNFDYMFQDDAGYWQLYKYVDVPCGHCLECKAARARAWAYRCMLEKDHSENCHYITLTYDDAHVPSQVRNEDFPAFMKRLRKIVGPGVRFFACSETGEHFHRPHFHAILFNCPLNIDGFSSPELRKAWPFGFIVREDVTVRSCAYVAQYTAKKIGDVGRTKLFMSRRPGIGEKWLTANLDHIAKLGKVYFAFDEDGQILEISAPRYADKLLMKAGYDLTDIKDARAVRMELVSSRDAALLKTDREGLLSYRRSLAENKKSRKERIL